MKCQDGALNAKIRSGGSRCLKVAVIKCFICLLISAAMSDVPNTLHSLLPLPCTVQLQRCASDLSSAELYFSSLVVDRLSYRCRVVTSANFSLLLISLFGASCLQSRTLRQLIVEMSLLFYCL